MHKSILTTVIIMLTFFMLFAVTTFSQADDTRTAREKKARKQAAQVAQEQAAMESTHEAELRASLEKQARTIQELTRAMDQMRAQMQQQMNDIQSLKAGLDQSRATAEEADKKATELAALPTQVQSLTTSTDALSKNLVETKKSADDAKKVSEGVAKSLNGFRFSGDFHLRFDNVFRSSNQGDASALVKTGAVQNSRARYRLRLNVDKTLDKYIDFHMQLGTGPINNPLTFEQDFTGVTTRHPFFISEAYADVHNEKKTISIRGGKQQEVFADNSRFLFDDNIRFNGFNEKYAYSVPNGSVLKTVEFRAGQYIFSNPNTAIVSSGSALALAGATIGTIGRSANLFHEGVVFKGELTPRLNHEFLFDDQYYRNPNEILLASTSLGSTAGYIFIVQGGLGLSLSGPLTGTGNGTTTPGGAMYTAPNFNVLRMGYKLDWKGFANYSRFPVTFNAQVARNTSANFLRDAFLTSLSFGQAKEAGDWRLLYIWSIKDANALISQVTDDDLGTGTGVNIATHHFRVDYTIRKNLAWQNLVFITNARRPSNPAQLLFVPLQRGAPTAYRLRSQILFSF